MAAIIDPYSADVLKKHLEKRIASIKDHICYGVDTIEKLQYARGKLSSLEELLQDVKDDLQTEDNDGTDNQT
jgi:hypothetical protein|tara:strand:- start:173 stop:388 length:216 start_codon:yes stop_codon:yes gene_type:complete